MAESYVCEIQPRGGSSWIPEIVTVDVDRNSGRVLVNDPIINHFVKRPLEAKISVENTRRITFAWDLEDVSNSRNQFVPIFIFRLTVAKATNAASITAKPTGYVNNFQGFGKCEVKK